MLNKKGNCCIATIIASALAIGVSAIFLFLTSPGKQLLEAIINAIKR